MGRPRWNGHQTFPVGLDTVGPCLRARAGVVSLIMGAAKKGKQAELKWPCKLVATVSTTSWCNFFWLDHLGSVRERSSTHMYCICFSKPWIPYNFFETKSSLLTVKNSQELIKTLSRALFCLVFELLAFFYFCRDFTSHLKVQKWGVIWA